MKNLIWDLDGTLINSKEDIFLCLKKALKILNINANIEKEMFKIGPPLKETLRQVFSKNVLSNTDIEDIIAVFREIYDTNEYNKTYPYENIETILKDIKNYTNYIVTNKSDIASKKIIDKLGWNCFVKQIFTPYTFNKKLNSKIEIFSYLIKNENLDKAQTFCIGDTQPDYIAGQIAGIKTIGVLWGTGTQTELASCDYICSSVAELKFLLEDC